ncbi:uncharacterized protein ATC70_005142 [Mucor velutinosus]|uniref:Magnesium transporter n=1 Tax=Mucor velutinosus TaxID=708070 RepID=A0AAN7HKB0_9FUNG|nr:hypothetical protein ATC70_005142 [Mucor velutinosus]
MSNYTTRIEESPPPFPANDDPEDIGYTSTFWIGLGVSVITNLIQAFALSFQRKSHLLNDLLPRELRRSAYKRPMWLFAFLSFLFANTVGSIFSIGYLPIVILAPIGAMNLAFNAFAANIVLDDPLSKQSILGTAFIALGALLVGFFGVIPEPNHSLSDLIQLYKKSGFIIYFTILETIIAALMLVTHYLEYRCVQIELKEEMEHKKIHGYPLTDLKRWIGISYGILSGNVSSQSMLFAKSGIELIIISITSQENQLQYPLTWFLLVMMILTGGLQLFYLNKGLRLCDTMVLIPLSFCAFNVSCLFNGLVYYNQWHRFEVWQLMNVIFGVIVTVFGVLLLSWQQEHKSGADEIGTLLSETDRLAAAVDEDGFDEEQIVYTEEDYDDEDADQDYALNHSQVNLLVKKKKNKHLADNTNGSIHL